MTERVQQTTPPTLANEARICADIDAGIDAACEAVDRMPVGQKAWTQREYRIAQVAARAALLSYQERNP